MIITADEHNYLMEGMHRLLRDYNYHYSDKALSKIITEWSKKKAPLIEAFKKHPNYLEGKFMIAFDTNYERPMDESGAIGFWNWLEENVVYDFRDAVPEEIIQQRKDDGCTCLPKDYRNFSNCTLSTVKDSENVEKFTVGANPICVQCGKRHTTEDNICCCSEVECAHCGHDFDIGDAIEIDGRFYCEECVSRCPICGENVVEDYMVYVDSEDRNVCPHCIEEHYTRCECCGAYVYNDDATHIEDRDIYVCESCADEHCFFCEECERYFSTDARYPYNDKDLCEKCYEECIRQEEAS